MKNEKIAIIGAGPAGIYTSLFLRDFLGEVYLFEQNKDIGEKLKTTGGGRMNVTNKVFTDSEFSSYLHRQVSRLFMNSHFENRHKLLEELGIEYRYEKNRAILKSQNAIAEVARLKQKLETQQNLQIRLNTKITDIKKTEEGFLLTFGTTTQAFDRVIITTGGMYRMFDLGDEEHIYNLPKKMGHEVTEVSVSLCPLNFKDKPLRSLSGISFVGKLTDKKTKKSLTDDLLITHFGVSGPLALDFSALNAEEVELAFISEITEEECIQAVNSLRNGKHNLKKYLKQYVPARVAEYHLDRCGISQTWIADLPKIKLKELMQSLFHYEIPPRRKNSYPEGWTTKGGVSLKDVKTKNLESKKVAGLHFAGEVLDFNGLCGGYNISFAMISAKIVAEGLMGD